MKFSASKDNKKRKYYNTFELDKINIKVLNTEKFNHINKSYDICKNFSKDKVKNRCVITSRSKGILSFFKLSRMTFKDKASFGFLEGIRKSSW